MADYYQLKNQNIFNPPANTSLGNTSNQFGNAFVQNDLILGNVTVTGATIVTPKVSTIGYPGDDTAADPAGGQTITLTGSGFLVGASVLINGSAVGVVSVVSSTTITFTSPANSAGSYVLYVINTDGGTAIAIPGIQYSGVPTWTTAAGSLGSVYETESFNQSVTATGDAPITYSLFSGSIPPGATFNSNGTITGTSQVLSSSTTYTFTVRATDAEAQDTNRSFSLTINPDVVTWASPANGTTYTSSTNSAISNVTLSATSAVGSGITYTANALPTGLSLTGANISGTPTVEANSSSLLTATANTTSESSAITINWVIGVSNDIYFEYNTLLIPGASTTFVDDASTNNFAVTINGDTKPNSFNPYTPGYYSNYFDGTGDYLTVPVSTALALSANYTIECWIYPTVAGQKGIYTSIDSSGDSWQGVGFEIYTNNCPRAIGWSGGSSSMDLVHQTSVVLNTWNHIALCRNNNLTYLYLNGVQSTSSSADSTSYAQSGSTIGQQYPGSSQPYTGYISNLRVVKGTAVYTSAFTPPTSPLTAIANTSLLTCQSNRIIDNSTNAFTLTVGGDTSVKSFDPFTPNTSYSTYGSGYFDGTGDYLTAPSNSALAFPADFTIECWVYPLAWATTAPICSGSTGAVQLSKYGANASFGVAIQGLAWHITDAALPTLNTWSHVALTRSGSTLKIFINGVQSGSTGSTAYSFTTTNLIGGDGTSYFQGYMTDYRVVKGTALYTTTFTPPTAPLTAIANTSLLVLQNNQSVNNSVFLDNSSNNFLVTRAGNTTQGTFSPYGGNWSNFYGTTTMGWQTPAASATNIIGTATLTSASTFTVEAWIYQLTRHSGGGAVLGYVFGSMNITGGQADWTIGPDSNGKLTVFWYNNANNVCNSTNVIPLNTWTHIAVSINAGAISMYINGVKETLTGTTTATTTSGSPLGYLASGGYTYGGSTWQGFNGYISNLRVVKSALYSVTFTPSTTPLTAISGTSLLTCQSNRFIDNSINSYTLTITNALTVQRFSPFNPSSVTPTSYSGYFDGNGDYLTASAVTGFSTTGDLTLECWAYVNSASAYGGLGGMRNSTSAPGLSINILNTGYLEWAINTNYSGTLCPLNQWFHVALVRSGSSANNCSCYLNGNRVGQFSSTTEANATDVFIIGRYYANGPNQYFLNGYVSNMRYVKGTALYSGTTYTVPTSPLTAIANTVLLTCQSTTFIDNSTNNFTITAAGNSQPTIQNPFGFTSATTEGYTVSTIGGSGYFDGTGDYLQLLNSGTTFNIGTGAFTAEAWVYPLVSDTWQGGISTIGTYGTGFSFNITNTNKVRFSIGDSGSGTDLDSTGNILKNTWSHIAMTRNSSGTMLLFINGVLQGTANSGANITNTECILGRGYLNIDVNLLNGYMTDVRVVKGTVLYTSNFVPPSAPLTSVQNTVLLNNMTSAGIYDASMMTNMETVGDAKLSTAISKFGGSSMSFDGTGDYAVQPTNINFGYGTGDFTIEFWLYMNSISADQTIFSNLTSDASVNPHIYYLNGTAIIYYTNGANRITGSALSINTWYHIAVCRASGSTKMFINGTQTGSTYTDSNNYGTSAPLGIGTYWSAGSPVTVSTLTGYIDDLRITKGYARYTSNFTPATSAFPIF